MFNILSYFKKNAVTKLEWIRFVLKIPLVILFLLIKINTQTTINESKIIIMSMMLIVGASIAIFANFTSRNLTFLCTIFRSFDFSFLNYFLVTVYRFILKLFFRLQYFA